MTVTEVKHQAHLQEWQEKIMKCRSSGVGVKQWCNENGLNFTTYYRWEREIFRKTQREMKDAVAPVPTTTFAELPAPRQQCRTVSELSATVHINDITIDIYPGMDAELLKTLLDVARLC